jgi:hypothetical protein
VCTDAHGIEELRVLLSCTIDLKIIYYIILYYINIILYYIIYYVCTDAHGVEEVRVQLSCRIDLNYILYYIILYYIILYIMCARRPMALKISAYRCHEINYMIKSHHISTMSLIYTYTHGVHVVGGDAHLIINSHYIVV